MGLFNSNARHGYSTGTDTDPESGERVPTVKRDGETVVYATSRSDARRERDRRNRLADNQTNR